MSDDDQLKRIGEILDALREQALPPEELARLERELDQYAYVIDPHAVGIVMSSPPTAFELIAFADLLKNRQGTTMPDFEQLWRKKAELDRKLLDEPRPMAPAPKRRW